MSAGKVRIGGWVDGRLKAEFVKLCKKAARKDGKPGKVSNARFLEMLLAEGVKNRRRNAAGNQAPEV